MRLRPKLTYANVVATLALFFAMTGGVVYAANQLKVRSNDIAARAVKAAKIAPKAVKRGKLAPGAVGTDQLASGAVGTDQIADGAVTRSKIAPSAVGSGQVEDGSIEMADLKEPVGFVVRPYGSSASVSNQNGVPYFLQANAWVQKAGEFDVIFGQVDATLAATEGGTCSVQMHVYINGEEAGGTGLQSSSSDPEHVTSGIGGEPRINFDSPTPRDVNIALDSNGCAPGSSIDRTRMQILGIG